MEFFPSQPDLSLQIGLPTTATPHDHHHNHHHAAAAAALNARFFTAGGNGGGGVGSAASAMAPSLQLPAMPMPLPLPLPLPMPAGPAHQAAGLYYPPRRRPTGRLAPAHPRRAAVPAPPPPGAAAWRALLLRALPRGGRVAPRRGEVPAGEACRAGPADEVDVHAPRALHPRRRAPRRTRPATPKSVLELIMDVKDLTLAHVKSHLQLAAKLARRARRNDGRTRLHGRLAAAACNNDHGSSTGGAHGALWNSSSREDWATGFPATESNTGSMQSLKDQMQSKSLEILSDMNSSCVSETTSSSSELNLEFTLGRPQNRPN
ncbi:hypothetical protein PR202_ga30651 [Eleusine coracana subsp. coracana]|uniref:Transcription factor KAN2 n=1 Tax=Eleusine coracana subsp. coracana TaxID=191504 RepID=A0AAV5DPG3_ELECO|nr:hypothetical protein PR202_ga30651 [Eleusine coracana subsp. coracana]